MNNVRRFMAGALWTFVCGLYQRLVTDCATPLAGRTRAFFVGVFGTNALVDVVLVLAALCLFVWLCRLLRDNRLFQWLYEITTFVLFSYAALFTWQAFLFLAYLAADTHPELFESAQTTIVEYIEGLLLAPAVDSSLD